MFGRDAAGSLMDDNWEWRGYKLGPWAAYHQLKSMGYLRQQFYVYRFNLVEIIGGARVSGQALCMYLLQC